MLDQPAEAERDRRHDGEADVDEPVDEHGAQVAPAGMEAPACIDAAISVGAVYDANVGPVTMFGCTDATTAADQITCFSNSNATLDLLAPGAVITSDWILGGISSFYGTSQAAPHVTGSVALLLEARRSLQPDEIEALLKSTGKPILDERNGVVTPRIEVSGAVSAITRARHRAAAH